MLMSKNIINLAGADGLFLGMLATSNQDAAIGNAKIPPYESELFGELRKHSAHTLSVLARAIAKDSQGRNITLVGIMRGGFTTTFLLNSILTSYGLYTKVIFIPTHRSTGGTDSSIISPASLHMLRSKCAGTKNLYLVDGWTGTGESLHRVRNQICQAMRVKNNDLSIKTTALLDMHRSADLYGSSEDFLIPYNLNYHSRLGVNILSPKDKMSLPTIEVGLINKFMKYELDHAIQVQKTLTYADYKKSGSPVSEYNEIELNLFRSMRIGLGINEALHRHYREGHIICVPRGKWNKRVTKVFDLIGVKEYKIVENQDIHHVYSIKASLLEQLSSFA
jgi:hypoxanthine phosphoribosyltransferase